MTFLAAPLLIVIVIVLIVVGMRTSGILSQEIDEQDTAPGTPSRGSPPPWDTERIFVYALSFAGLIASLYAITGLVATVIVTVTQQSSALVGTSDVRDRTSYYLASIIVGLPIWLALWVRAQRRADRSTAERQANERRWYLAGIFAVTSVVALFALHSLLQTLLTLPGTTDRTPAVRSAIFAVIRVLVWGGAWLAYARLAWRERSPRDRDEAHDLAVYALSGFALVFLVIGLDTALRQVVGNLASSSQQALLIGSGTSIWGTWGSIAAWLLAGSLAWGAIWQYDLARGGLRFFRVLYLYLVWAAAAAATFIAGVSTLYELLRRIFGYQVVDNWGFLRDLLPPILIGAAVWAYHWMVMRRLPRLAGETDLPPGAIPWPRHPAIALLNLAGLAMLGAAVSSLLWLGLDAAFNTGVALSGGDWWRDRYSLGLAAGLIGGVTWLAAWSILQRAADADPARERSSQIRRRLLGLIVLAATLIAVGFTVAMLWTIIRSLLDGSFDAATASRALKDLSAVLIALAIAIYHGLILRGDRRLQVAPVRHIRVLALVESGQEGKLVALRALGARKVERIGLLSASETDSSADPAQLQERLAALDTQTNVEGALLILRHDGATLHPFTTAVSLEAASEPDLGPPNDAAIGEPNSGGPAVTLT